MGYQIQSRLLNLLGLLSAGVLLANPGLVNAQAGKQNANLTESGAKTSVAEMPAAPEPDLDGASIKVKSDGSVDKSTIVDIAAANKDFRTLAVALKAADLAEALSADGPFTVFAPTEKAFSALPDGALDELLKPENKALLVKILTYHVVPGKLTAADLKTGPLKSLEGSPIAVHICQASKDKADDAKPMATKPELSQAADLVQPGIIDSEDEVDSRAVKVNQATVKIADIKASNGVIHGIDQVILPPEIMRKLSGDASDAVDSADLPETETERPESEKSDVDTAPMQPAPQNAE